MSPRRRLAVAVLLAAFIAGQPSPAFGWANGESHPGGFGTHDWVLHEADRIAGTRGVSWLDETVALPATDDPDTVLGGSDHHIYERWGPRNYGHAPTEIAALYAKAVTFLRSGYVAAASDQVALLSHYYSDLCVPLHTDRSAAEKKMHDKYETRVDGQTAAPGVKRSWITSETYVHVANVTSVSVAAAGFAHVRYKKLVGDYNAKRYSAVDASTKTSLNRAVNDLADIIQSIREDADYTPGPAVGYLTMNRVRWVYLGASIRLSGALKLGTLDDTCTVEVMKPGGTDWTTAQATRIYSVDPSGSGLWKCAYRPTKLGWYSFRVKFAGNGSREATQSGSISVSVKKKQR